MGNTTRTNQQTINSTTQVQHPGTSQTQSTSRNFLSNFGRSNGGPSSSYAQKTDKHLVLREQANTTLKNVDNIIGRNVLVGYPPVEGQVYSIKQGSATYQGGFVKGFPSGHGVAYFRDGGYYTGNFVEGDASGKGLYVYPNGSIYEGEFLNSQYNGQGTLVYIDTRIKYNGSFKNGLPEGRGKETYNDGSFYEGEFSNGEKEGQGVYQWCNGQRYEGAFLNGLMHGRGVLTNSGNVIFQGDFIKGLKSGFGVFRTPEGTYEGNFENDFINGNGSFLWNDGKVYEGNFYRSMMHGRGKVFYPSNQVAEGEWENNHNKILSTLANDSSAISIINKVKERHQSAQISAERKSEPHLNNSSENNSNIISNQNRIATYQQDSNPQSAYDSKISRESSQNRAVNYN